MMFAVELYSRFALNTNRSGSAGSAICMLTNLKKINFFFFAYSAEAYGVCSSTEEEKAWVVAHVTISIKLSV